MITPQFEKTIPELDNSISAVKSTVLQDLKNIMDLPDIWVNFFTFVEPIDTIFSKLREVSDRISTLAMVHSDDDFRAHADELTTELSAWELDTLWTKQVYEKIKICQSRAGLMVLDPDQKRLMDGFIKGYEDMGFDLDPVVREEMLSLMKENTELSSTICRNVTEDKNSIFRFSPDELNGTDLEAISDIPKDENGLYMADTKLSDHCGTVLTYVDNEEIRKNFWVLRNSRCKLENTPLFNKLIQNRNKIAQMLGHSTHSQRVLKHNMVATSNNAKKFCEDIISDIHQGVFKTISDFEELKFKHQPHTSGIKSWDLFFYTDKLIKEKFNVDMEAVSEYFEMNRVLKGVFDLYENIFDLKIEDIQVDTWHPDVMVKKISDKPTGEYKGLIYLDLFMRPGKYAHFCASPIQHINHKTGAKPAILFLGSWPKSLDGEPNLLDMDGVRTVFHEWGHALHYVLSHPRYESHNAFSVAADFVELPSTLMESFAMSPEVLQTFAFHYDTGEPLDLEIVKKIKEIGNVGESWTCLVQVARSLADIEIHRLTNPETVDVVEFFTQVVAGSVFIPGELLASRLPSFDHLTGGYDSQYYSYKWADTLVADMESKFLESPQGFLDKDLAMKLRKEVYEVGATRDDNKSVEAFLGRPFSIDAYLRKIGAK